MGPDGTPDGVQYHQELESINIAAWTQTAIQGLAGGCLGSSSYPLVTPTGV